MKGAPSRSAPRLRGKAALPRCPDHLTAPAAREWRRVASALHGMGVLTTIDRAALAAYCQAYGRWVEAEERMRETPLLVRTPAGYVQQSPLLGIINKQLELMGRYLIELGMTPASRSRVSVTPLPAPAEPIEVHLIHGRAVTDFTDEELEALIRLKPPGR